MICLLFTISLAEIFKFPIELINPLFSILFFIFKLLVFSSPNNSSPSFFRYSASIVKVLTAPIELSVLLKIFLALIFKLSFARYFPSKFKASVVEISIFLVA